MGVKVFTAQVSGNRDAMVSVSNDIDILDFDVVDDSGTIHPYPLTVMVQNELAAQFTRAAVMEGLLAFRIPDGNTSPILRYYPKDRGEFYEPRWLALE